MRIKDLRGIYGVQDLQGWAQMVHQRLDDYGMEKPRMWPESATAYVSDGRWVADCPYDNGGIAVAPGFPSGFDMGCGTMLGIVWPDGWQEAVEVLEARQKPTEAHWFPQHGETVSQLREENLRRGVAMRRGE